MIAFRIEKKPSGNVAISLKASGVELIPPTAMSGEQLEALATVMLAANRTWSAGHTVTIEIPSPNEKGGS